MSNNFDVVVVGGGISGQSRLRALLSSPALREVAAYGGAQGGSGLGLPPGASRLSMHLGNKRCQNPPLEEGFGVPLDRSGGLEVCRRSGARLNFFPERLPNLHLLEFSKGGEGGRRETLGYHKGLSFAPSKGQSFAPT